MGIEVNGKKWEDMDAEEKVAATLALIIILPFTAIMVFVGLIMAFIGLLIMLVAVIGHIISSIFGWIADRFLRKW